MDRDAEVQSALGEEPVVRKENKRKVALQKVVSGLELMQELRRAAHRAGVSDAELREEIRDRCYWTRSLDWVLPLLEEEIPSLQRRRGQGWR